ncbi:DUF1826 domain-containing protein [Sphingomonas hengshuiensis]|uniref:DUF1826 domain-containing protein n=1 Tax=Sphingomonas hengshuiensis TaxID=1609977 RepID=UPI0006982082|nr:DUF1826 domain-containing protein [Sphingomonas hengshuiensis]
MTVAAIVRDDSVVTSESPEILRRIVEPDVHLAVWARPLPHALTDLQAIDWDTIDDIDAIVAVDALTVDVPALVAAAGYAEAAGAALTEELVALCTDFGAIMGCTLLKLRLEVVETDACRRFHTDNVTARLLMPLVGPGTQWIHAGADEDIRALRAGEVGVFKGRLWAEKPMILHRSPPIAATGETRLLFALNPWVRGENG